MSNDMRRLTLVVILKTSWHGNTEERELYYIKYESLIFISYEYQRLWSCISWSVFSTLPASTEKQRWSSRHNSDLKAPWVKATRRPADGSMRVVWTLTWFNPLLQCAMSTSTPAFDFKIKMTHNMIAALSHKSWRLWIIYLYVLKSLQVGVWYRSLPEGNIFI